MSTRDTRSPLVDMSAEEYPFVTKTDSHSIGISIPSISSKADSNPALVTSCESTSSGLSASLLLRNLKQGAENEEENIKKKRMKGGGKSARGIDGNKELMKKGILEIDLQQSSGLHSRMVEGATCSTPLFSETFDSNTDSNFKPISCSPSDSSSAFDGSKQQTGVLVAGAHGSMRMLESEGSFDGYISTSSPESGYGNVASNMKTEHSVGSESMRSTCKSANSTSNLSTNDSGSEYTCTMTLNAWAGDHVTSYSSRNMLFAQEGKVHVSVGQVYTMYWYMYMFTCLQMFFHFRTLHVLHAISDPIYESIMVGIHSFCHLAICRVFPSPLRKNQKLQCFITILM